MNNINNTIEAHYNELEINDFDFYNDFNNNFNNKDMESIGNLIWEFENGSISAYKLIEKLKEINDNINNY